MPQPTEQPDDNQEFHPRGTVVILVLFVLMIIALWGSVYLILLSQGAT